MNLKEFIPRLGEVQALYCGQCGEPMRLVFRTFDEDLQEIRLRVENLPFLHCDRCSQQHLTDRSRSALFKLWYSAKKSNDKEVNCEREKVIRDFGFTKIDFLYDADDY